MFVFLKRFSIICSLLLGLGPALYSQFLPPPTVYVSGGSSIYSVTVGSGTPVVTLLLTLTGSNFESVAIGPDNVDTIAPGSGLAAGNALHPVLLYACDIAGKKVIRFDPAHASVTQLVYNSAAITPVCGRSTSTGDFYVSDKVGGGVFKLSGSGGAALANVSFSAAPIGASALPVSAGNPAAPRAITQKYIGDPLVVDNAGNKVLRAPFANLAANSLSFTAFIQNSALLSGAEGIARASTGAVFVSNTVLKVGQTSFPPVAQFKGTDGSQASSCSALNFAKNTNQVPAYLASLPVADSTKTKLTDTVYLITSGNTKATLWSWNTSEAPGNCSLTQVATIQNALSGIAVAPAPVTLVLPVTSSNTNPTATTFNFNSHLFQLTATGCSASVTSYPVVPSTVNAMISLAGTGSTGLPDGATPVPNLGEQGYEIVYVAHWLSPAVSPACTSVFTDLAFEEGIYGFYDANQYSNSRIVWCDNGDPNTFTQSNEPQLRTDTITGVSGPTSCGASQTVGVYPIGGPIPGDQGTITRNSFYAVVNANTTAQADQFCGFQSPLSNTTDPSQAPTLTGNTINVKFKLATASGSCQNGPYVSDASALISVAQIKDSTGATIFNAIRVNATANSLDSVPLFNAGNNQYSFSLNIASLASGTYSLTVTFLTDNQTNQTTYFKIP